MTYKSGLYRLDKSADLFEEINGEWVMGESVMIRLTKTEANALFNNKLYERLGFVGWSWLEK